MERARMKTFVLCLGLVTALAAGAADGGRARLIGQRIVTSGSDAPILVCQYQADAVKYEVVASARACAPYLPLSKD
jgi:hypothetical protein